MSFAQFLRLQRSCRVRRSGDRGPVRSAVWQGRPDPALLRYCWCAVRAVHPTRSRGHKGQHVDVGCVFVRLHVLAKKSSRAGRSGSGTVQDVWIRQAVAALTGRPARRGQPGTGRRQVVAGRAHLPTTSWTVLEGPCPTASSTCPLQGSGYAAPRQARTTRSGRHVCALQVLANSGAWSRGPGADRFRRRVRPPRPP